VGRGGGAISRQMQKESARCAQLKTPEPAKFFAFDAKSHLRTDFRNFVSLTHRETDKDFVTNLALASGLQGLRHVKLGALLYISSQALFTPLLLSLVFFNILCCISEL
jgi:hypothetical protein